MIMNAWLLIVFRLWRSLLFGSLLVVGTGSARSEFMEENFNDGGSDGGNGESNSPTKLPVVFHLALLDWNDRSTCNSNTYNSNNRNTNLCDSGNMGKSPRSLVWDRRIVPISVPQSKRSCPTVQNEDEDDQNHNHNVIDDDDNHDSDAVATAAADGQNDCDHHYHHRHEHGYYHHTRQSCDVVTPHVGMRLQVYQHEGQEDRHDHDDSPAIIKAVYELLEPMELELGIMSRYAMDYAYRPVLISSHTSTTTTTSIEPVTPLPISDRQRIDHHNINNAIEDPALRAIWQWWLPSWKAQRQRQSPPPQQQQKPQQPRQQDYPSNQHEEADDFAQYDMNDRAFAGGSHGEVWRGRKHCTPDHQPRQPILQQDILGDATCTHPLVLKRIKVGSNLPLLEAGLREIYFGGVITGMGEEKYHSFTHYVDHFFRDTIGGLELWIVFYDAGMSLRNFLYTGLSVGDLIVYQHSWFWTQLRFTVATSGHSQLSRRDSSTKRNGKVVDNDEINCNDESGEGEEYKYRQTQADTVQRLIRRFLGQTLEAAAVLHRHGIVHRDIKPSNIMCTSDISLEHPRPLTIQDVDSTHCVLGDFSSAYNSFVAGHLYTGGPSRKEQTDEYAPPEAIFGYVYDGSVDRLSPAFDSWSIGIVALELLLGTPSVFSVDQRTRAVLAHKLQKAGASPAEIEKAMYLAALSQYCIFNPSQDHWPLRSGDPLHNISMTKASCTLHDFKQALRARDPLGLGFESVDQLLHLIWQLLTFDPENRMSASEALQHPYFHQETPLFDFSRGSETQKALESLMLDPRMDFVMSDNVHEFVCPKCRRTFGDWRSCWHHTVGRRHGKFCDYDRATLPTCLNAHSMLPAHTYSGHCDIQGRRMVMEDFHAVRLSPEVQFYAIFDGHNGNFASKFVASCIYDEISSRLPLAPGPAIQLGPVGDGWKEETIRGVKEAFVAVHDRLLEATRLAPHEILRQSGTTATIAIFSNRTLVIASIGDSRAVLSSRSRSSDGEDPMVKLKAIQLTVDHVASDDDEQVLVRERGGSIQRVNGVYRVNGTLAITRSLGDANLSPVLSREAFVIPLSMDEVHQLCGHVTEDEPCFVIIASDGLWDTMSNDEAVELVAQYVSSSSSNNNHSHIDKERTKWYESAAFQRAAEALTLEAYVRGSSDNIGVCVVAIPPSSFFVLE